MTKPSLYAHPGTPFPFAALAAVAILLPTIVAAQDAPCAACVAVAIARGQALVLPPSLDGLEVLVRTTNLEVDARAEVDAIRDRGGVPGLLIDLRGEPATPERIFLLKQQLARLRGAMPHATIALDAGARLAAVDSYVDVNLSAPAPRWRQLDGESVEAILQATTSREADRWLWRAPADVTAAARVIAGLVRARSATASADRFAEGVEVTGARLLSVDEIIARHQAAAARQAALVRRVISTGTLTLTFEAPGFPAPVTIGSETVIYRDGGRTDLEQRAIRVNGIEFGGEGVPKLPIIEPERVASPPLAIALTSLYRYRLEGRDTVGGTPCYVVAFEPVDRRATLFRGRAWIAADDFGMVKVAAVQTGLRGPIVASEQTDTFTKHEPQVWLLARSDTRQMYEGAAHRTPIHRVLALDTHIVNPADFDRRRTAAYTSSAVMLRDTAEGYRYLRRERPNPGEPIAAVEPIVAARADRIRTLAAGVIIDPNISVPLPFAGLIYVDFNLLDTGAQINAFFGGSFGQLAFSVPSLGGSRWQLAGRAFAIASSYNDRAFVQGRELYEQAIRQRPASASVWMLRPLTARVSLRAGYDLDYARFSAAEETATDFLVPANQVVHGVRLALDMQRDGWNASAWWNAARRSGWRAWGAGGARDFEPADRDFQRYGVTVARSAVLTPGLAGRLEGALMAGEDLDRFSRYSFGTFDNRLRGYPSALVRYDRGGVVRGALAWAARPFMRLDLFADSAMVRDPGFGSGYRDYTGVGAALEAPAPFGTLVAVEWGYGFRGVRATGHIGTHVIRVTGYKVF